MDSSGNIIVPTTTTIPVGPPDPTFDEANGSPLHIILKSDDLLSRTDGMATVTVAVGAIIDVQLNNTAREFDGYETPFENPWTSDVAIARLFLGRDAATPLPARSCSRGTAASVILLLSACTVSRSLVITWDCLRPRAVEHDRPVLGCGERCLDDPLVRRCGETSSRRGDCDDVSSAPAHGA